ncbi:thiamine pyrophosphate-binding protein [Prauserella alba]|uniref:Thiamine pyrophosphate-binding protein n=1 Tax=Prauserella alba TaxID=176898 RepID=A0ABP4G707_9PSEU|nr:thiamine pyrophosphate-binding protein [Prauserella alba]MCP2180943.1 acetolactate synthase-1/2/3 large subunit [Prauserella alba]
MAATGGCTAGRRLADALRELEVDRAFGLPGVHNLPAWNALSQQGVRLIGVRHEQSAAFAADGYARATGRLGVAVVTTGPGAANTLAAVGEAHASASPVIVIATDVPATLRTPGVVRGALHETSDQGAMFAPVTKATLTAESPDDIARVVRRAGRIARRPQSGPVYVGIPADFLTAEAADPVPAESTEVIHRVDVAALLQARELLSTARRPVIWAGGGALRAGAGEALGQLAECLAAPIITTYAARGIVPPDHPCRASNPVHTPEVGALWDEADVVLAVGTDFDGMMTQNWRMPKPSTLITINVDPADAAKNYPPDLQLTGDAREVTENLALGMPRRSGLTELSRRLDDIETRVRRRIRREEPQAAELLTALAETVPDGAVLVSDMCVAGYWIGGFYRVPAPRKLAYPMGWGTLGFGFPASLGVAAAGGGRAVCVTGDGGFLYGVGELATAIQENLPITVVVVDDSGYGMLRYDQTRGGLPQEGVDLVTPDFVGLAKSFGVDADRVDGFGRAFRRRLREFTRSEEPNLLVVAAELSPPLNTSPRWYRR